MNSKNNLNKNQPILVTGGGGYIGTYVVEELLKQGYHVRVYDQFIFGQSVLADLLNYSKLEVIKGEMYDFQKLSNTVKGCWAVVHLAGLVGDPASLIDEDLTIKMNIICTSIIKEISKVYKVERFIFASSCSVYGASSGLINEKSKLNPLSLYAKTKIDSEKSILYDKDPDFHPTILRFATAFGHSRRPRFDLVVNLFTAQAYNDGSITIIGEDQWRPFIHAKDIAKAIIKILEAPFKKVNREIYDVGDSRLNTTIGELAELVIKIVKKDKKGNKVKLLEHKDAGDKRNYKVSFEKIKNIIGFEASINLDDGIREIYDNFKKGLYKDNYKDPLYINAEMTKLMHIGKATTSYPV